MYFFSTIAFAALPFLVGAVSVQSSSRGVISIPISKRSKVHKAVTVESLEANIQQTTSKLQRGFKVYKKNTGKTHALAAKQVQSDKRDVNIVPLIDVGSTLWTGEIWIGTPPKKFIVQIDTGSSDLFIPGPSCQSCGVREVYDHRHSSTAHDLKEPFTIPLTGGSIAGLQYKDNVNFGGFEAKNQTLGAASTYNSYYSSHSFVADGLLGMGFEEISVFKTTPVFTTLFNEGLLTKPTFGLVLAAPNPKLILGGRDTNLYKGDLTFVTIDKSGFWQTDLDDVTIDGSNLQVNNKAVVFDSGTTLILGNSDDIVKVYDYISNSTRIITPQGSALWKIPCGANADIQINFGGVSYRIPPASYVRRIIYNGSEICYGGFAETSQPFWVIGDVFLENVYAEFDMGNRQIGFAQLADAVSQV